MQRIGVVVLAAFFLTVAFLPSITYGRGVYSYLLNLSMDELMTVPIESSGLFAMNWDKAPGINYAADTDLFEKYSYRSIGEYLQKGVPGIHTATHGNQGTIIGVRGILLDTNSKTILLRDNLNINTRHLVGVNGSKLSTPLMGDIERVEVSLGPGTVRHGSGAINGFINLISATGKSKEGFHIKTSYGSGDSRLFEASYGQIVSEKLNVFLYGGYSKSNGVDIHYAIPKEEWSLYSGATGTPSEIFLDNAKIGKTDNDFKLSFRAQYGQEQDFFQLDLKTTLSRTTNVDPALGYYLDSNSSWAEEIRLAAEARGAGRYSPFYVQYDEEFIFSPELVFNTSDKNTTKVIPYYIDQRSGNEFSDELRDWVRGLNLLIADKDDCVIFNCAEDYPNYGWETHTGITIINNYRGIKDQEIGFGTEYRHSEFHYFPRAWDTVSIFGEDLISKGDFSFLLGLRYDKIFYENSMVTWLPAPTFNTGPYESPPDEDALTKRFALSYSLDSKQAVKLSYQEGFRFADKFPQHWVPHQVIAAGLPESSMDPEESTSYELNYSGLKLFNGRFNITSTLYYNIYEKTHGWIADQSNFGNSGKKLKSYGGEFAFDFKFSDSVDVGMSYSYSRPDNSYETDIKVANNDTWTRYPEHMFKMKAGWMVTKEIFIGSLGVLESPRYNKEDTALGVADLYNNWNFVADAMISYQFNESAKLLFTAKELIRKNYHQSTAYFQGTRPLDSPRAKDPQYYLTLTFSY